MIFGILKNLSSYMMCINYIYKIESVKYMNKNNNTNNNNTNNNSKYKMETTECGICVEKYNKSSRTKIACLYCDFSACRQCCETWILNESTPICVNNQCGKEWTRSFLSQAFTKSFITNGYKTHRENVIFDKERALLPATQPIVENLILRERLTKELASKEKEVRALREQLLYGPNLEPASDRALFIKACSDPDCRGFLKSNWRCGLCEKWSCSECHEIKGLSRDCEHTCNPDNVATAALLKADTKSCPGCGTGINKLDGCDQMFCTMCNTGFSWRTGRIETNIHNPHYFEWLRRTGGEIPRNPNEIRCGHEITNTFTRVLVSSLRSNGIHADTVNKVTRICESIIHFRYVELVRFPVDRVLNNQDLRIDYLRNKISEENFKIQIQRLDKKHQKNREIHNVLTILYNTITDILYRFENEVRSDTFYMRSTIEKQSTIDILNEIENIREYVNECLLDISNTYSSKRMVITESIRIR